MQTIQLINKKYLLGYFIILILLCSTMVFGQQGCPDNFILPQDSDETNINCADIDIDDGIFIINSDNCSYRIGIELDLNIPMSTVITDNVYFDINLVDENFNYVNMNCLDDIYALQIAGGLQEGADCNIDESFIYEGSPIALGDLMDGFYLDLGLDRPSEYETNCYHLVFEFSYTDEDGVNCSYYGEFVINFPAFPAYSYTCGSFEYAGNEDCEFPTTGGFEDYEAFMNFASSFDISSTSMCGTEVEVDPLEIFFLGDEICLPLPPGGCAEIELNDCPGDVNQSGCITALDLIALRRLILGLDENTDNPYGGLLADVNQNDLPSTIDVLLITKWILGISDSDSPIGDCVLFDPTSDGLAGVDLDGLGGWTSDPSWSVEVCDGDDFELVMGVLGDVNGSCPCDVVEGLGNQKEIELTWNKDKCTFDVPRVSFYDMALDFTGEISEIKLVKEFDRNVNVEINNRERGHSIIINSNNRRPISLQECMSYFEFECRGEVGLSNKSFVIDSNANLYNLHMDNKGGSRRDVDSDIKVNNHLSMNVLGSSVYIKNKVENSNETQLSLYTIGGRLISTKKINGLEQMVDYSNDLDKFPRGSIFIVAALSENGEQRVEKLIW